MEEIKKVAYGEYYVDMAENGRVYKANDDFLDISGYSYDDIASGRLSLFDFVPAEYREEYRRKVTEFSADNKTGFLQHPFVRKDGSVIHILCLGIMDESADHKKAKIIITDYSKHIELLNKYDISKSELELLTSTVPGGILILRLKGESLLVHKCNNEFYRLFNISSGSELLPLSEYLSEDGYKRVFSTVKKSVADGKSFNFELKIENPDETVRWLRLYGNMYTGNRYSQGGGDPLFYLFIIDVTEDVRLNNELIMQTEKFRVIADDTDEIYFDYDISKDKMTFNSQLNRYCLDDNNSISDYWKDNCPKEFIHPQDYDKYKNEWIKIISTPQRGTVEFRTKAYDDDYAWYSMTYVSFKDEQEKVSKVFGKMVNIQHLKTLKNKIAHDSEYIKYLLETDSLTGLLNRKAFKEKAEKLILGLDSSYSYGLVYSDINDFSYVNENFGYEAGNKMLKDFANILQNCPTNLLGSRIYSDFFVGLYRAPSREELLRSIEERNTDFTALQKEKYPASDISVSCGIYVIPDRHTDITIAIDNANLARRSVKNNSSIICGIYSQRMRTQRAYEQSIASELHSAISNKLIEMFLQPKFDIDTRQIIGAEALARWRNLDGTYKMPVEFIPVLEKVGYIDELDFFIYEEVLRTVEQWKKDGRRIVPVSVNFSQHHVRHPRFTDMIVETADKYDVDKSNIEIEITESCFSGDMQILFEDMGKLRSMGFKVSIDDFGIGYSTLSVLMKAPVDIVKIDKSFIDNLTRSRVDREFLNNMCKLIETVNKDVIFEGVESEEQAQILSSSGHTKAQGWLFDKAIPLKRFNEKYMY